MDAFFVCGHMTDACATSETSSAAMIAAMAPLLMRQISI